MSETITTANTDTDLLSPYQCAKVVNAQLKDLGIEKVLPPQMFYTYTSPTKNYIASVTVDGKRKVSRDVLAAWFVSYVNKLQGKVTVTVTEQDIVEADNDGTVGEWTVTADDNSEA